MDSHKLRQARQLRRIAPFIELRRIVGADEIKQFCPGKFLGVIPERVHGVGNAAAPDFLVIHFAAGLAREREPQQLQPEVVRRRFGDRFEGRLCGRNNEETVQLQLLQRRLRHEKMPQMHRVERSAKNSKLH